MRVAGRRNGAGQAPKPPWEVSADISERVERSLLTFQRSVDECSKVFARHEQMIKRVSEIDERLRELDAQCGLKEQRNPAGRLKEQLDSSATESIGSCITFFCDSVKREFSGLEREDRLFAYIRLLGQVSQKRNQWNMNTVDRMIEAAVLRVDDFEIRLTLMERFKIGSLSIRPRGPTSITPSVVNDQHRP